ncbi:N-acetyl sugar amidotransferase [Daejeonella sp. JGW-45]|uniref:N-acetyl sugar amidotransferase n=1 Tax=Daejeonella sp. JGW-45 TaxID=3034148 RepID=UPI0023EB0F19|nr:N-acetyl sugar amidotransferase [Daejeonella sp. JGW-45]
MSKELKICSRCIYDSLIKGITFDNEGVCNYCHQVEKLKLEYKTGSPQGAQDLEIIIEEIKRAGKGKKYDCVVGVSGGTDSSFLLAKAVEWGLRPLAAHYDNTWNTSISTENIRKVTSKLGVDLFTIVVDNKESDDIFRSFLHAGVPEFDCPTDIALAETLYRAASKHKISYLLEGHSFITEGVSPMSNNYFDGKYIEDIHNKYGKLTMKTFPNMTFFNFLKWTLFKRIRKIRPLWYIDYNKEAARKYLEETFDWKYYGGHHMENRSSAFGLSVYLPTKFKIDNRKWALAASARGGFLSREEALAIYNSPIEENPELIEYVKKRLSLSDEEYDQIITGQKRSFRDFKTYKKRFELLRPLFHILAKANLVPMSFYIKYCFPLDER